MNENIKNGLKVAGICLAGGVCFGLGENAVNEIATRLRTRKLVREMQGLAEMLEQKIGKQTESDENL